MVEGDRRLRQTGVLGLYLADAETFIRARSDGAAPVAWQPLQLTSHWRTDTWGGGWLELEARSEIGVNRVADEAVGD